MEPRLSIPTASSPFQTILERSLRWDAYFYFWMICSEVCSPEHQHPFDSQFRSSTSDPVSWGTEGTPFPFHQLFHVTSKPFTSRVHSNGIETEESFPGKLREFGNGEWNSEMPHLRRCGCRLNCVNLAGDSRALVSLLKLGFARRRFLGLRCTTTRTKGVSERKEWKNRISKGCLHKSKVPSTLLIRKKRGLYLKFLPAFPTTFNFLLNHNPVI